MTATQIESKIADLRKDEMIATDEHSTAAQRRAEIASLQQQLSDMTKAEAAKSGRKEQLERGWDGYQFIGVERGREIAATM